MLVHENCWDDLYEVTNMAARHGLHIPVSKRELEQRMVSYQFGLFKIAFPPRIVSDCFTMSQGTSADPFDPKQTTSPYQQRVRYAHTWGYRAG